MAPSLLHSTLFHFPPPRFLAMPAAGINLSDHSIKVMELAEKEGMCVPKKWGDISIKEGIVENGDIKDLRALTEILQTIKEDFDLEFIRASIPEEKAYIFSMEVPQVAESDLRDTIAFQLQDHVPLGVAEVVFDYDVIDSNKKDVFLVNVSVLPREVIEQYVALFSAAGLIPLSFEMEGQTIARAVVPRGNEDTHFLVDIGRTRTGLSIITNNTLAYTATLSVGGDSFTQAIQEHLNLSHGEAEKLKQEKGFVHTKDNEKLYMALVNIVSVFRDEINKRISYWQTHRAKEDRSKEIKDLIMTGGNASVPGLKNHFESSLEVPVLVGNVWANVLSFERHIPVIDWRHSLTYASVIGLALSRE